MTRVSLIAALMLAAAVSTLAATNAQAGIVAPEDAADLAQALAEAQEEQDICYGWNVANNFAATPDVGSSVHGPDIALNGSEPQCRRGYIELTGSIDYACDSCDGSDSASVTVHSSFANGPTEDDLGDLGLDAGELTGDNDDTTLINMVNALPLLAADRGLAPYLAYEPATSVPPTDRPTNKPGSDLLRDMWPPLLFCGLLVLAGPGFYLYKRHQESD